MAVIGSPRSGLDFLFADLHTLESAFLECQHLPESARDVLVFLARKTAFLFPRSYMQISDMYIIVLLLIFF